MPALAVRSTLTRLRPTLPWIALLGLLCVLLCHEWFGPDIWYHLYLGGLIAATFQPQPADHLLLQQPAFVNVYWVFQLLVRGLYEIGGIVGVGTLFGVAWIAAFAAWVKTTRAFAVPGWGALLTLAAILVCQTRFEPRPEVISYTFLAIALLALTRWPVDRAPSPRLYIAAAALQVLWTNLHGYFIFGPALVALKLGSVWIAPPTAGRPRALRNLAVLLGITLAASLVSPFPLRNWAGVLTLARYLREMHQEVQELLPPTGSFAALWTVKLFWLGWASLLLTALYTLVTTPRRECFALALGAAGLFLSATSFRNLPLLVFLGAPLTGILLALLGRWRLPVILSEGIVTGAAVLLACWTFTGGLYESLASSSGFGIHESPAASPVRFVQHLARAPFSGVLFNSPLDGGYLEFHRPDLRLYGDSRLVEAEKVRPYFAALKDADAFLQLSAQYHFDAALLNLSESGEMIARLLHSGSWRLVYGDLHRAELANQETPLGAALPAAPLELYHGEDLTLRRNGLPAIQWIAVFTTLGDDADLATALEKFGKAPQIPSVVLEYTLLYARMRGNAALVAKARDLRPKLYAQTPADAESVDRLLAQLP